jgi:hypothetical protein
MKTGAARAFNNFFNDREGQALEVNKARHLLFNTNRVKLNKTYKLLVTLR